MEEFMVCVDRIIASSSSSSTAAVAAEAACFEVSVNNAEKERVFLSTSATGDDHDEKNVKGNEHGDGVVIVLKPQKSENGVVRECRICQEEDEEQDMETPCACNGTLKFAHRKCIQRWCNKKGDISCEICNQKGFSPNYTLPPTQLNPDVVAIEIRQTWGANINLQDPHFLAFAAAQHQFLQPDYEDYTIASSGPLSYFCLVVIASMLLLIIRQTLMVTRDFRDGARVIYIHPYSNYASSASWFPPSLLCDGPFMVHRTMSTEEAVICFIFTRDFVLVLRFKRKLRYLPNFPIP